MNAPTTHTLTYFQKQVLIEALDAQIRALTAKMKKHPDSENAARWSIDRARLAEINRGLVDSMPKYR